MFPSQVDEEVAKVVMKHPGITQALLDDILRLMRLGPATFTNAKAFYKHVDSLPGILTPVFVLLFLILCR
jgi:hypothetical protein